MATVRLDEQAVFDVARRIDSRQARELYLQDACSEDAVLEQRVRALLQAYEDHANFLESPAATLDGQIQERPGTVIGPYKLLEQIGEGGFAVVFLAEQMQPVRRKVALKVLKPGMDSRQVVARFEAERQALAIMDHPHIAKVFDGGATPSGRPYFVMELVKGVPITDFCDQNHLTPRQRLELFIPVCQAVQHAHQKGIIHRDLKPSNVLVSRHDTKPIVKVIDFGVAKALGQDLTEKTLFTGMAQMIGTPLYMSPEQAGMSDLDVDTRSDIYSLGVLLYELLTGTTPVHKERFRKATYDEICRIIREEEPPKPSTRLSDLGRSLSSHETLMIPGPTQVARPASILDSVSASRLTEPAKLTRLVRGELDWIVMKALEKDRSRRYETANAFAMDLQRYLRNEPVEACPPSAWYRFRKFAQRNNRALSTMSGVAVAVLMTAAVSGVLIWRAYHGLHQALDRERLGGYFERIALAEREWGANNLSRMEQLLDACPEELRNWEWGYLKRLRYGARSPLRHESGAYCVAFSPDGQYLATSTKEGFIRLYQAKTFQELSVWQAHETNAPCVEFSPDSRYLASSGWDATVKVWDVARALRKEASEPILLVKHSEGTRVWHVSFRPGDGQRLASCGTTADLKAEVKVWDVSTGREILRLGGFDDMPYSVRFSPDGRRLATAGQVSMVRLWDAETGQQLFTLGRADQGFTEVSFSPDGRLLAAVGGNFIFHPDRDVEVWDTQTGQQVLRLHGHVGALRTLTFSPDGRRLASAGLDQTIKLWDVASGQVVLTLRGHIDNIFGLAFSPDGRQLASASLDKTVRIWDATPVDREPGPEYLTFRGHTGAVTDVAFNPTDGRSVASADADGLVQVWDFGNGQKLGALRELPSGYSVRVAYSPDGRRLAACSGGEGRYARVWDLATAEEICGYKETTRSDQCVAFSPDGRHVASAGMDFLVRVWNATTGKEVQAMAGHDWPIHSVAFNPDGRRIASCSADSTVRLWDWTTGEELFVLEPRHSSRVAKVAFSRDGQWLASAGWDRTVKVWETASGKLRYDLPDPAGAAVLCVTFGRDYRRLAWGGADGTVKVWDGLTAKPQVLRGHTSWVQAVAFSPDGEWLASASLDGTVKIWHAPPEPKSPASEEEYSEG